MAKSLAELDSNFQVKTVEDGQAWYALDPRDAEGIGWVEESQAFTRYPDRAQGVVRDPVWELSRRSAGILTRFITDAPQISVRWDVRFEALAMDHMPATGVSGVDLYSRDSNGKWRWAGIGRPLQFPTNQQPVLENIIPAGEREYLLYLPLYNGTAKLEIGVPEGATFQFAPRDEKPVLFYGTSILQGGCASRPGMAYPAIAARMLDVPHYNFGFSGNAFSEPEVANLLAELDPAVYVLDPLPNMQAAEVTERIPHFVRTLRAARPQTPIVLVENIVYQSAWINSARAERMNGSNEALKAVYEELKGEISGLHYVETTDLLGDDSEATVDGTHATDIGFLRMAEVIAPVVKQLL